MVDMNMAEKAVKSLWKDSMTVFLRQKFKNPNGTTGFQETAVIENEPCRISYKTVTKADQQEAAKVVQEVKLLCGSALQIPPGSKIAVTHQEKTTDYQLSGEPAVYTVHQEIILELFKEWA